MGKNLFDYATKELSQDAFILWLLDSWNSDNEIERTTSRKFIQFISGVGENENIQSVWIKPQWYRMDVSCFIAMGNREVAIFIEDKVTSSEHNQLQKYNDSIRHIIAGEKGKLKEEDVKRIFYKTDTMDESERKRVQEAGWQIIEFDSLRSFWSKFIDSDHMIIRQYAKHVCSLWEFTNNTELPTDNNTLAWKSFFDKQIVPLFKDWTTCWTTITRYKYTVFCVQPKGTDSIYMPYLEIRSRDCLDGSFNAKILMYGVNFSKNPNGTELLRAKIHSMESNGVFKTNYGEKRNKQVGRTPKGRFSQNSVDGFIDNVRIVVREYLEAISIWNL